MAEWTYRPPERAFLGEDGVEAGPPAEARAVVIPFPLEATVTYGAGTARGPEAIIAASGELELYDVELGREAARDYGIATLDAPLPAADLAEALDQIAGLVEAVLDRGRFPLVLGGEHSLTAGAVRPFAVRYPDLVVLQFDAHADLRDVYRGERFNHACAMRRVLDQEGHGHVSLLSLGVRSFSGDQAAFLAANADRVAIHWAKDRARWDREAIMVPLRGRPVYVSFDVDAFDPALMPATGTPEPGGLLFDEAVALLAAAADAGTIVGADVVELAPISGLHACDFTAAKLAYKIMSYALASRS